MKCLHSNEIYILGALFPVHFGNHFGSCHVCGCNGTSTVQQSPIAPAHAVHSSVIMKVINLKSPISLQKFKFMDPNNNEIWLHFDSTFSHRFTVSIFAQFWLSCQSFGFVFQ